MGSPATSAPGPGWLLSPLHRDTATCATSALRAGHFPHYMTRSTRHAALQRATFQAVSIPNCEAFADRNQLTQRRMCQNGDEDNGAGQPHHAGCERRAATVRCACSAQRASVRARSGARACAYRCCVCVSRCVRVWTRICLFVRAWIRAHICACGAERNAAASSAWAHTHSTTATSRRRGSRPSTATIGRHGPLPHLHRDWARPCHICTGTGGHPCHICNGTDRAHPCHICTGTDTPHSPLPPGKSP